MKQNCVCADETKFPKLVKFPGKFTSCPQRKYHFQADNNWDLYGKKSNCTLVWGSTFNPYDT